LRSGAEASQYRAELRHEPAAHSHIRVCAPNTAWAAQPAPTSTRRPVHQARSAHHQPPTTAPPTTSPSGNGGIGDRLRDRLPFPFGNGPGFLSIGDAINGWFRDLAASSLGPLMDMVARTILATPT
jgi:hypothetical protein